MCIRDSSKVSTGVWAYCPKSEWKTYTGRGRGKKTEQITEQVTTKRGKKSNDK